MQNNALTHSPARYSWMDALLPFSHACLVEELLASLLGRARREGAMAPTAQALTCLHPSLSCTCAMQLLPLPFLRAGFLSAPVPGTKGTPDEVWRRDW